MLHQAMEWNVWDVRPSVAQKAKTTLAVAAGLAAGWLVFERMGEKRRVAPIPEGWEDWSDEELRACLERAELVRRKPIGEVAEG